MNASGLWRGRCQGKIGNFKFINVEILPNREERKSRSSSLKRRNRRRLTRPRTVQELLRRLNMEEHIPVFVLNGYENLTLFQVNKLKLLRSRRTILQLSVPESQLMPLT
jgi:hypothetical protein